MYAQTHTQTHSCMHVHSRAYRYTREWSQQQCKATDGINGQDGLQIQSNIILSSRARQNRRLLSSLSLENRNTKYLVSKKRQLGGRPLVFRWRQERVIALVELWLAGCGFHAAGGMTGHAGVVQRVPFARLHVLLVTLAPLCSAHGIVVHEAVVCGCGQERRQMYAFLNISIFHAKIISNLDHDQWVHKNIKGNSYKLLFSNPSYRQ